MSTESPQYRRPRRLLRHHAARRRAVARQQPERLGEAGDRPSAGAPGRRRDRGRFPGQQPRRFRRRADHRPRGQGPRHLRPGPLHRERHPHLLGGHQGRRAPAHPHLRVHLRHPSGAPDAHEPPGGGQLTREMVELCVSLCPGDVEFSAMDATRSDVDFLAEVLATAIAGGGDHHQRARHGGLRAARASTRRSSTSCTRRCPAWRRW